MIRVGITLLIILVNFIVQTSLGYHFMIGNAAINFLLIMVVSVALIRGKLEGAIVGLVSGLIFDSVFGDVLGFYGLIYMYFGLGCGFLNRTFYKEDIVIPMFIIGATDLVYNLVIYIFTYLLRGRLDIGFYLTRIILPEVVYTTIASILMYRVYLYLNHLINSLEKKREESFEQL